MSLSEHVFMYIGMASCLLGFFAIAGLLFWQGLEWWIKFNDVRKPLMAFYADQLKRDKERRALQESGK
jgi:hypothetical protein